MHDNVPLKGRAIRRFFYYGIMRGKRKKRIFGTGPKFRETDDSMIRERNKISNLTSSNDRLITVDGFFRLVVVHNDNNMLSSATQKPSSFVIVRRTRHTLLLHIASADVTRRHFSL